MNYVYVVLIENKKEKKKRETGIDYAKLVCVL